MVSKSTFKLYRGDFGYFAPMVGTAIKMIGINVKHELRKSNKFQSGAADVTFQQCHALTIKPAIESSTEKTLLTEFRLIQTELWNVPPTMKIHSHLEIQFRCVSTIPMTHKSGLSLATDVYLFKSRPFRASTERNEIFADSKIIHISITKSGRMTEIFPFEQPLGTAISQQIIQ
jgi:hypothetical protein